MNRIPAHSVPSSHLRVRRAVAMAAIASLTVSAFGCGGGESAAKAPTSPASAPLKADEDNSMQPAGGSVGAEFGGMNESKVQRVFESASDQLVACWQDAAAGMPYLGGDIRFTIKVDASGKVVSAYAASSAIGDRDVEQCMLGVLRAKSWPRPVGGQFGLVQSGLSFEPSPDHRAVAWGAENVAETVRTLAADIDACKSGIAGTFTATAYIGTLRVQPTPEEVADDGAAGPREVGKIQSVGIAPPDERGEAVVDCLVAALRKGSYPPPSPGPAKVTFEL